MEAFKAKEATWEAKEDGAEAPAQLQKGADATEAADDEPTGVENVRYGAVTDHGAPVKPATAALVQRQALTSGSTERFGGEVGELEDEDEVNNYEELIAMLKRKMEAKKPLTPEEEARLKRRERTQGMIAGISDMAQALSNLFFTSQYAPDMYNPKAGMGAKAQERFDKAKAQREADDALYLNYALQLGKARDAVAAVRERKAAAAAAKAEAEAGRRFAADEAEKDRRFRAAEGEKERKNKADVAGMKEAGATQRKKITVSGGGGKRGNFKVRRRKDDGTYEVLGGFKDAPEARNYAATYADEGWEYVTESVKTTRVDVYGDTTTTVRNESSPPRATTETFDVNRYRRGGNNGQTTPPPLN